MTNLGIVYKAADLDRLLNMSYTDASGHTYSKGKLIGLAFYKPAPPPSYNPDDLQQRVAYELSSRIFYIDRIYYDENVGDNFVRSTSEQPAINHVRFVHQVNGNQTFTPFEGTDMDLLFCDYQHWKNVDFVLMNKHELKAILHNADEITVSGCCIDYGIGQLDYRSSSNGQSTIYGALKAETDSRTNTDQLKPDVIVALPCPPWWGYQR